MIIRTTAALFLIVALAFAADRPKDAPVTLKYQVVGLFSKERVADFREAMKKVEKVELVSVDYDNAEAVFRFVPKVAFPHASKPEHYVAHLNNAVRHASTHTIGVKPPRTAPRDKLKWVEIPVSGCHCKACDLALYDITARVEGVEQAQASFKEGKARALIDPTKTDRDKIIAALKKRGVSVKAP
jgi:cation transport ATPase